MKSEPEPTADEAQVLRQALSQLVVRERTGEIGIMHGMNRFVSTHCALRKPEREALDSIAAKLGVGSGVKKFSG